MKSGAPDPVSHSQELGRPVADALAALSPETRAALWLHVVEGAGVREVAACLDSSRSAVSRRIRAGLDSLRARLARSGIAVSSAALLRDALRGSEAQLPESLILGIIDAGRNALAVPAGPAPKPDALDFALAAPARSLPPFSGIGIAVVIALGVLAVLGGFYFQGSEGGREGEPAGPIAAAPAAPPAVNGGDLKPAERPMEPAPPPAAAAEGAVVAGTLRSENGEPIASADVYLAMTQPIGGDLLIQMGSIYRPDYFKRTRFFQTRTDGGGRFRFEGIRGSGDGRLGAFKEGHADPRTAGRRGLEAVKVEEGAELTSIDLVLPEGQTLAGRILAADGSPVADAVVSVPTAWSPKDHIFWPAGLGPTDSEGRFRLGFEARAAGCHLRVNSDSRGQDFFLEVPVGAGEAELTLQETARIEGTITWSDGSPATGLTVRVNGRLPEPPIPIQRMGLRSHVVQDGLVENGTYRIDGLHPRLDYDVFIIDGSLEEGEALRKPLTPSFREFFRLDPGEVKVWDKVVSRPITVRGRIRTELTGTPVPEGQVSVRKDGKRLNLSSFWADPEGYFELRLTTGPGEYRIHAEPPVGFPPSDEIADLIDARFGRTLLLSDSQAVEMDLLIFEPVVLPIRVLDHAGAPVKVVESELHVTFPNDRAMQHETSTSLDGAGRARFLLYHPAAEFWYRFSAQSGGPAVETPRYAGTPGTVLPEWTVSLPRASDLIATILDPAGQPRKESRIRLRVTYEDGSKQSLGSRTDGNGRLSERGRLRAAPLVVEILSASSEVLWRSPRLNGGAAEAVDLGKIVLDGPGD